MERAQLKPSRLLQAHCVPGPVRQDPLCTPTAGPACAHPLLDSVLSFCIT